MPPLESPTCPICSSTDLSLRKVHRTNLAIAVIGYALLVPCAAGLGVGATLVGLTLFGRGRLAETLRILAEAGIPPQFALPGIAVLGLALIGNSILASLGGLLLTMTKQILKCESCGAVVPAS